MHAFKDFNLKLSLLCWNINGVTNKFENNEVKNLFMSHDVVVVMETHFLKRYKCPENFEFIGKSKPVNDVRRGGVAVYKKSTYALNFRVYKDICPDAVVFSPEGTSPIIFIAPYITPSSSKYAIIEIFRILDSVIRNFQDYKIIMIGDLNSRCGTPKIHGYKYVDNPDKTVNVNGKRLIELCCNNNLSLVNGLKMEHKTFDSKLTFFRGRVSSQNDWCITNCIGSISEFLIHSKLFISDHSPVSMCMDITRELTLSQVESISNSTLSDEFYDNSNVMKKKIQLKHIDTSNLPKEFDRIAESVKVSLENGCDISTVSLALNDDIYDVCSKRKCIATSRIPENKLNLNSHRFRAIADINLHMYSLSIQRNDPVKKRETYYNTWAENIIYASIKEKEEFNEKVNVTWQHLSKSDPKKMWDRINYNDKCPPNGRAIDAQTIRMYFTKIFQADKIIRNPTVRDVANELNQYHMYIPVLDDDFTIDELNAAIQRNGNGTGLDGLDKKVANLFTLDLRYSILQLFNSVYGNEYPDVWRDLLLRPEEKKGHTQLDPKLRGVAISQLLPTLYDILIYNRFNLWYHPNIEQAGFRTKQGCPLQIFSIYVIMEYLKTQNKTLYVGFLDYEKAFDFVNRPNIIKDLMKKGAGSRFTRAVAHMYDTTCYVPKVGIRIGEAIISEHGVTQGRQTSTSLFSFQISDMGMSVNDTSSCLDGSNLLQLADDTALLAEDREVLLRCFCKTLKFSLENFMFANVDKTFFLHCSDNPDHEPIVISDEVTIYPSQDDEYVYLGVLFIASCLLVLHIQANLKRRKYHIAKYYQWLAVNEFTPVKIKIHVLYSCMFNAYLYAVETWWEIDHFQEELLQLERKFLRSILRTKPSTPDDLLYLELNRPDLIAIIKHRQYYFFQRLLSLPIDDAIARRIVEKHRQLPICQYYDNIDKNAVQNNKETRKNRVNSAGSRYLSRYRTLIDTSLNHVIYDSGIKEQHRMVITKWRLSNHKLRVETGRRDLLPRSQRVCLVCQVLEDEEHVLFACHLYSGIRSKFHVFLQKYPSINTILNPSCESDATMLGTFLLEVEKLRRKIGLE